ncbi:ROK family transcriptional regulator [Neorhizobium galegae]|uniref:ROK family transcriptional regulator n=1 Tax=Neorhizobium galegae TaxID=399 RepID=UPI001352D18B|nr:ROK family transcriptional regulator [Neorhizobium galegae]KAB1115049.1 ROK family transcriptional regulator [Neorhizobium galegae]MCQ1774403.1 ROK family transcriptional regulator [Neorhizobium galegae]MCQ1798939.1 ROK family transcriptional regulator [Neorhizobium galegae]
MINLGYNERRLIEMLRGRGGMSRTELARDMDVSAPTLTRLTSSLLEAGLIREAETHRLGSGRGKPSTALELDPDGLFTIGVYFNPDDLRICVADLNGKIRAEIRENLNDHSFQHIMNIAGPAAKDVIAKAKVDKRRILGCGLSFPGHFSRNPGHVFQIPQFAGWHNVDVDKDFQPFFDYPVHHENDGKAVILSELYYGVGRNLTNFAMIWLTYGIGGGVVVQRHLYRGSNRNAGEFGGLFPKSHQRPSGQDLCNLLGNSGITINRLCEIDESYADHPQVTQWLERATDQLRSLALTVARTLDPSAIVFGGSLPDWLIEEIVKRLGSLESLGEDFFVEPPEISKSDLSEVPHLGAATIPLYRATTPSYYSGRALKGWA